MRLNNLIFSKSSISKTKLLVMDFDGVMTDGGIYLNETGDSFRRFDVKDGLGIKLLQKNLIHVAIISGSNSKIIRLRGESLGIKIIRVGISDKLSELKLIQKKLNIIPSDTLFLGDDINDLIVLDSVSSLVVPANAHKACKKKASLIANSNGGNGFIREIIDLILFSKGIDPYVPFKTKNDF